MSTTKNSSLLTPHSSLANPHSLLLTPHWTVLSPQAPLYGSSHKEDIHA